MNVSENANVIISILNYLKPYELIKLSTIKNLFLHSIIQYIFKSEIKFKRFYDIDELKELVIYRNLNLLLDINYFESIQGKKFLNVMKNIDFQEETTINLKEMKISSMDIKYLSICEFKKLNSLILSYNNLSETGLEYFMLCEFDKLSLLDLKGNNLKDKGIEYLIQCSFRNLKFLNLNFNNISFRWY